MPRGPKTRYGFPPERDPFAPFPAEIPWNAPIAGMGWWLEVRCETHGTSYVPLRLLAAQQGWDRTLAEIVPRLRCDRCGKRPVQVVLVSNSSGEHGRAGAKVWKHDLLA